MDKYKDPAFLFYPESFLVGVAYMTDEEVGQYIKLMCLQHQKGHIPDSIMRRQKDAVREKFVQDEQGEWYNERLEYESKRRADYVESRRRNGKKGGRPRKENTAGVQEWVQEVLPAELQEPFMEFVKLREDIGSPIGSKGTVTRLYNKLKGMSRRVEKQKMIIEQSVDNNWKNFYALPDGTKVEYKETPTQKDTKKEYVPMPKEIENGLADALGFRKERK